MRITPIGKEEGSLPDKQERLFCINCTHAYESHIPLRAEGRQYGKPSGHRCKVTDCDCNVYVSLRSKCAACGHCLVRHKAGEICLSETDEAICICPGFTSAVNGQRFGVADDRSS